MERRHGQRLGKESFQISKTKVYAGVIDHDPEQTDFEFADHGKPDTRCGPSKVFRVDAAYDNRGVAVIKEQIAKAALRLARLLQEALE